jgi:tungstate transport system substrate-binding protein
MRAAAERMLAGAALAAVALSAGCSRKPARTVTLATTTSTENSGLLDALKPEFRKKTGIEVDVIPVGTGKALKLGENGDVDVVLVHAPSREEAFVKAGFGLERVPVMHNDFVVLGSMNDPAGVRGMKDAPGAFAKIARAASPFVSRGDDSGTHIKEKGLWKEAAVDPAGAWYVSAGQGMGAVLVMANEKQAYTLADRGTFIAFREKIALEVLVEGDPVLANPYGVIAVNHARHPHVKRAEVAEFIAWLTSAEGQRLIAGYRKGGEQLFFPERPGSPDLPDALGR